MGLQTVERAVTHPTVDTRVVGSKATDTAEMTLHYITHTPVGIGRGGRGRSARVVVGTFCLSVFFDQIVNGEQPRAGQSMSFVTRRGVVAIGLRVVFELGRLFVHHQVGVRVVMEVVSFQLFQSVAFATIAGALIENTVLLSLHCLSVGSDCFVQFCTHFGD